ncbi:hypothetical protein CUJ84_Chr004583 [Rhizobium leguminosarum]|uniref:Uncharacterized protein n=1 Tax=Rhizobium leguminosarum TaxID=384 RepID=A0A2K9Z9F1_RHILE|nr:hypothetical protein CUJ84_Chr004583 [Rhizobium leguminosarum]
MHSAAIDALAPTHGKGPFGFRNSCGVGGRIDFLFGEPVERFAEFISQPDPHHNLYSTSESRNWLRY